MTDLVPLTLRVPTPDRRQLKLAAAFFDVGLEELLRALVSDFIEKFASHQEGYPFLAISETPEYFTGRILDLYAKLHHYGPRLELPNPEGYYCSPKESDQVYCSRLYAELLKRARAKDAGALAAVAPGVVSLLTGAVTTPDP